MRLLRSLFILLMLLYCQFPFGKQPAQQPLYLKFYRTAERIYGDENSDGEKDSLALSLYNKVISILEKQNLNDSVLWDSYYKAAIYQQTLGNYGDALMSLHKCLSLAASVPILPQQSLFLPNLYAGNSYYVLNRLDSARYYYSIAETIADKYPDVEGIERLYNTMGVLDYETANYSQSKNYFSKAIALAESSKPLNIGLLVNYKNNLASVLRKQNANAEAIALYQSLLKYQSNTSELLHNIGSAYLSQGDYEKAIYYLKSVRYNDQNKFNDLGLAYLQLKKTDSAKYFLGQAASLNQRSNAGRKNTQAGLTHKYTGDYYLAIGKYNEALTEYHAAINQLVFTYNDNDVRHNPEKFEGTYSVMSLLESLLAKAKTFYLNYNRTHDLNDLEASVNTYKSIFKLTDYVERTYETDEARLVLNNIKYSFHRNAIDAALKLYSASGKKSYLEDAYEFDEKNKASTLLTNVQESNMKLSGSIPAKLLSDETNIKQNISRLTLRAANESDSAKLGTIEKQLIDLNLQLTHLQDEFEKFPDYKKTKFSTNTTSVKTLQQQLPVKTAILSYHIGDSSLVCFLISASELDAFETPINSDFFKLVTQVNRDLKSPEESNQQQIKNISKQLYSKLIKPAESQLPSFTQLIIIPDDELAFLPFEILVDSSGEYLLKKYSINYNYSCSLLAAERKNDKDKTDALAFAPFSDAANTVRAGLSALPGTMHEVSKMKGAIYIGDKATKDNFLRTASSHGVIHLATHALADDENPIKSYIAFYPTDTNNETSYKLFLPEIYNLRLDSTNLVILTACETGSGQLIKGEGIMSLSRAFTYAGCSNIITSLWKADDDITATIAISLHNYLKKGKSPAEAMRLAKLDFLKSDQFDARQKSPGNWATLRVIGTIAESKKRSSVLSWMIPVLIATTVVVIKFRSRKRTGKFS